MAVAKLKQIWENEYFKTAIMIVLMIAIVFGFWYGSQLALNTQYPALAVASGSMCTVQGMKCDGWSHPFEQTLHIGDLIIVQGVDADDVNDNYPNSDIIVFHKPKGQDELIVHRVVAREERNGITYLRTKGDGNGRHKWPEIPDKDEYDSWLISKEHLVGKVILRIPWVGHIALFLRNSSGIFIILFFIIILVIIEFIIPVFYKQRN
ncbi:MAG: S26 family signal peptidase [Candidatus Bathyarchaeia archaeon]|nr:S26 family signal peptidase [Candidatus Bathyarchaeia archaeon]